MSYKIYIPIDSTAKSLGVNEVVRLIELEAQSRKIDLQIIRNGSRGLFWLEPMLEVETDQGRIAYGPVTQNDIESLFDAEFFMGKDHPLFLGLTEEIEWLKKQERLTFARVGVIDPINIKDYEKHDGFKGLKKAIQLKPNEIVKEITDSGLRGRGGGLFLLASNGKLYMMRHRIKNT